MTSVRVFCYLWDSDNVIGIAPHFDQKPAYAKLKFWTGILLALLTVAAVTSIILQTVPDYDPLLPGNEGLETMWCAKPRTSFPCLQCSFTR